MRTSSKLSKLAKKHGLEYDLVWQRWRRGDRGARLVRPPDWPLRIGSLTYVEWSDKLRKYDPDITPLRLKDRVVKDRRKHGGSREDAMKRVINRIQARYEADLRN